MGSCLRFSWGERVSLRAVLVALLLLPTVGAAQQAVPVADRIRLLEEMRNCWKMKSSSSTGGAASGSAGAQADGVFKKLISGKASLEGGASFKTQVREEFAPLQSDAVAAKVIEACYRLASGGDSLNLASAPAAPPAPKPLQPTKAHSPPAASRPPEWTCRDPAVFLSARCDKGGLGRDDASGKIVESQGVVRGWQKEEKAHATRCEHTIPSEGSVTTRSSCEAKDGAVRLTLVNRVEGKGGYSAQKDCSRQERCPTSLAYRIDEGGAAVRIPLEAAGRYDLQVDSFSCTDMPSVGDQRVHLQATLLGAELPLEAGKRFHLTKSALLELHLRGNLKFELDSGKDDAFSGRTGCEVSLSLQPHGKGAAQITFADP